jgi:hypothetical protein
MRRRKTNQVEKYNDWLRESDLISWEDPIEYSLPEEPIEDQEHRFIP